MNLRLQLRRLAFTVSLSSATFAPSFLHAAYTYTKIVDTTTFHPGSSSPFKSFDDVSYDGQNIAFIAANGAGSLKGVYQWNAGQLSTIAYAGNAIPSAASSFTDFANLSLDNGKVAFQGAGGTLEGVYTNLGGSLRRVADTTMTMPGSTARFQELLGLGTPSFDVAIDDSTVYFSGFGNLGGVYDEGVYRETNGALTAVANRSTTFPGQSQPSIFYRGEIDADEGHVLFEPDGLFTTHGVAAGQFRKIFDRNSALPGLTPPLSIFSPNTFSLDNGSTAFIAARGSSPYTDYLYIQDPAGVTRMIANSGQTNPVTNNVFSVISQYYSLDNNRVLFSGWSLLNNDSVDAIYLSNDSGYDAVLSDLDSLDSKNITGLGVSKDALVGRDFVFQASFSDGTTALYLAKAGPDLPTQTVSLKPTFDVQLRPGNAYPIGDGTTTLVIDGGFGTSLPILKTLLEFPLSQIPAGAQITSAKLKLDPTTSSSSMVIDAMGYVGDGLASLSDEFMPSTHLGSSAGAITSTTDVTITLDEAYIQSLLGSHSHLGLRLQSASSGPLINIASLESTTGVAPTLSLTFSLNQPGDFDGDADADGADFLLWQRGYGTSHSDNDLAAWRSNFGAGGATASSAATPEPMTATLISVALVALSATTRGKRRERAER